MTILNPIPCLVCGMELTHATGGHTFMDSDVVTSQPSNGVAFSTSGNYGSELFDSIDGKERLEIVICDGCVKRNRDRTRVIQILQESNYGVRVKKLENYW
jgi:hypothetical protein